MKNKIEHLKISERLFVPNQFKLVFAARGVTDGKWTQ